MSESDRKKHRRDKIIRQLVSSFFALILSVFLLAIGALAVAKIAFSKGFLTSGMDDAYYSLLLKNVSDSASDYTIPVGLPDSVLDDVFSAAQIREDVLDVLDHAYEGEEYTVNVDHIREKLTANVEAFFASKDADISEETDTNIEDYVKEICKIYQERVELPGINLIISLANKIDTVFYMGFAITLLISAVLVVICLKSQKYLHRGMRYLAYAAGGASLMSLAAPLVVYVGRAYERLQLNPEFFYYFATNYVRRALLLCMAAAGIWFLVTIVLIACVAVLRRRAKGQSQHRKK